MFREGELRKEDVCSGKLIHLDGHDIRAAIQCARWAKEEGIPTVIDIDKVEPLTPELIKDIDFVVTSSRFPSLFTGISDREKALIELQKHTRGFLCTTLGPEGAMALVDGEILYAHGFQVDVVDTTGAGDVFHGGFHLWSSPELGSHGNLEIRQCRGCPQMPRPRRQTRNSNS